MNYLSNVVSGVGYGVGYVASYLNPWSYGASSLTQESVDKLNQVIVRAIEDLKNDASKMIKKSSLIVEHVIRFEMDQVEASIHFNPFYPEHVQIAIHRKVEHTEIKEALAKAQDKAGPVKSQVYLKNFESSGKTDLYTRTIVMADKKDKEQQLKCLKACFAHMQQTAEKPALALAHDQAAIIKNQWTIFKDKSCPTRVLKEEIRKAEQIFTRLADYADFKPSLETIVYEMGDQTQNELFKIKHQAHEPLYQLNFKKGTIAKEAQLMESLASIKEKESMLIEPATGIGSPSYNIYETYAVEKNQFDTQFPEAFIKAKKDLYS